MKIKLLLISFICLLTAQGKAQSSRIDTMAVSVLDRMSETIGELNSCSVTARSNYDVASAELGLVKHSEEQHLYIGGPTKLLVRSDGDKGNHYVVYNGKTLSYYSLDKNHYSQTPVPDNVVDMIDHMNKTYGIVFPVADFLYPGFVDDILAEASDLALLGMTKVDGKDCYHIAGRAKDKTFQFWIDEGPFYLPVKMVIVQTDKPLNPQFEAVYTDWQINPNFPAGIFEFKVPPGAKKIKLTPLAAKK